MTKIEEAAEAERKRLLDLTAKLLSEVMALDEDDQIEVLALTIRAWCYARDRQHGRDPVPWAGKPKAQREERQ